MDTTQGIKAIGGTASRHYIWAAVLLAAVLLLALKYRRSIEIALAKVLPARVLSFFNIGVTAIVVFLCLGGVAEAATTCCALPAVDGGSLWSTVAAVLSGLSGLGAFGAVAFAPDVREAKLADGNRVATFTPSSGVEPAYDFFVDGTVSTTPDGRPLVATAQTIELATTLEVDHEGTDVVDDSLARLIKNVTIHGDPLGTILDSTVGTGAIVKQIIEFVGNGFCRAGDAVLAKIEVPEASTTDHAFTRYWTIPHAQQWLPNPLLSAIWLGILNRTRISVTVAAPAVLDGVSDAAITKGTNTLKVSSSVVAVDRWYWPMISQWILENSLPGGSTSLTLRRFGETNASGTDPVDFVHTIALLSNLVGLPGNQTIDNIASITVPKLGLPQCQNIPAFVKARLEAQKYGRSSQSMSDDPNYVADQTVSGMNLAGLKALYLRQPTLDMSPAGTLRASRGTEIPIDLTYTSSAPANPHAVVIGSLRFLNPAMAARLQGLPGSRMPAGPDKWIAA